MKPFQHLNNLVGILNNLLTVTDNKTELLRNGKVAHLRPEPLFSVHLGDTLSEGVGVARLGLNTNLDSLHGSQSNVGKELCTG